MSDSINAGLTKQQVSDAMRSIRDAISNPSLPNTDVLELTKKFAVTQPHSPSISHKQEESLISTIDNVLNKQKNDCLIEPQVFNESMDAVRQFVDAANKKNNIEKDTHYTTLESIVVEALKPQLSAWLNANLPQIVQSIVEKEIKKLVP